MTSSELLQNPTGSDPLSFSSWTLSRSIPRLAQLLWVLLSQVISESWSTPRGVCSHCTLEAQSQRRFQQTLKRKQSKAMRPLPNPILSDSSSGKRFTILPLPLSSQSRARLQALWRRLQTMLSNRIRLCLTASLGKVSPTAVIPAQLTARERDSTLSGIRIFNCAADASRKVDFPPACILEILSESTKGY